MEKKSHKKKKDKCSRSRSQSVASSKSVYPDPTDASPTFKIKVSKVMGRYVVAAKDLRPGSVIIHETPLVVGPCTGCNVQCLGCYQPLEQSGKYAKCKKCGWPLCQPKCPGLGVKHGHTEHECSILEASKSERLLDYSDFSNLREHLYAIVPLRALILKLTHPKSFQVILNMESHDEIRKNIPEVWNLNQKTVVDRIRNDWGLEEFSEEEIHKVCGVLEVNCFEIGQQGVNIRGLYPTAFLMSHDCVPNTNHTDEAKNYTLTVRASTFIQTNQPITLSYAYTLQSTLKRREHLLDNKFFECQCRRCKDPTELGTYLGALRCPKCEKGYVLSKDPLDPESDWSCNNKSQGEENKCPGYTITAVSMERLMNRISDEVDSLDSNDIPSMETFLQKYRNVLHPTHYLCLGVKLSLSQLYGKINGYLIHELSNEQLVRKREICREIIKVFDVIEPGYTRLRGVTLYEMHAPIMILITRQFENRSLSKGELRTSLKEVVKYLEEASAILSFEPETSAEGMIGLAAKDALLKIKDWEKIIGRI